MKWRAFAALLGGTGVAVLTACSGGSNLPPPAPLPPNPHRIRATEVWSRNVGGGGGDQLLGLAPGSANGVVVAAGTGGQVAEFKASNGHRIWTRHVNARLAAGPAIGSGLVVVTTRTGDVVALDAGTGKVQWKRFVGAPAIASPAIGAGIVAVKTMAGALVGLAPQTGREVWTVSEATPSLTLRFDSQPLIVNGVVYAGFADGKAIAADPATGKVLWRTQVATGAGGNVVADMVDVGGLLGYAAGDLYVATYQGKLAALDASSGQILWSRDVSSYTGVTLDAAHVYVADAEGRVRAFDLVTGVPKWTDDKLAYRSLSAPIPYGAVVVVGDKQGYLHFVDRNTGQYMGRVQAGDGPIRMPPVVVHGLLVVLTGGGTLVAYRLPQPRVS